jgi:hypothetical protein
MPHDIFLHHFSSMLPHRIYETAVMKTVKSRIFGNLNILLGKSQASVPSFLTYNIKYSLVAGFDNYFLVRLPRWSNFLLKTCFILVSNIKY